MIQKIASALMFYILIVYTSKDLKQRLLNQETSLELVTTSQKSNDVNVNMNEMELVTTAAEERNDVNLHMNEMQVVTTNTQESNDVHSNTAGMRLVTYTPEELNYQVFCKKVPSYSIFKYLDLNDLKELGSISANICRNMLPIFNELATLQLETIQKYFSLNTNFVLKPAAKKIETLNVIKNFPVKITNTKFTCDSPTNFRNEIIRLNKNGFYFPFTIKTIDSFRFKTLATIETNVRTLIYLPSRNMSHLSVQKNYETKLECSLTSFDERYEFPYGKIEKLEIEMHIEDTEEKIFTKKELEIRKSECKFCCACSCLCISILAFMLLIGFLTYEACIHFHDKSE